MTPQQETYTAQTRAGKAALKYTGSIEQLQAACAIIWPDEFRPRLSHIFANSDTFFISAPTGNRWLVFNTNKTLEVIPVTTFLEAGISKEEQKALPKKVRIIGCSEDHYSYGDKIGDVFEVATGKQADDNVVWIVCEDGRLDDIVNGDWEEYIEPEQEAEPEETFIYGETVEVSDNESWWTKRIFIAISPVASVDNKYIATNGRGDVYAYAHIRKPQPPIKEVTLSELKEYYAKGNNITVEHLKVV